MFCSHNLFRRRMQNAAFGRRRRLVGPHGRQAKGRSTLRAARRAIKQYSVLELNDLRLTRVGHIDLCAAGLIPVNVWPR